MGFDAGRNNLTGTNFVGTYTGGAEGFQIGNIAMITALTGGATNLTIDFNPGATTPQPPGCAALTF